MFTEKFHLQFDNIKFFNIPLQTFYTIHKNSRVSGPLSRSAAFICREHRAPTMFPFEDQIKPSKPKFLMISKALFRKESRLSDYAKNLHLASQGKCINKPERLRRNKVTWEVCNIFSFPLICNFTMIRRQCSRECCSYLECYSILQFYWALRV